MKQNAL